MFVGNKRRLKIMREERVNKRVPVGSCFDTRLAVSNFQLTTILLAQSVAGGLEGLGSNSRNTYVCGFESRSCLRLWDGFPSQISLSHMFQA